MADQSNSAAVPDNMLGICHRAGADLGIDPLWLRLGFAVSLIFAPAVVFASYLALGVVVYSGRWLFAPRRVAGDIVPLAPRSSAPAPLPLAA